MKKQTDAKTLWTLFKSMFVLSACTFGGGFVIVSLMKKKFVEELQWLDESEMLDITRNNPVLTRVLSRSMLLLLSDTEWEASSVR